MSRKFQGKRRQHRKPVDWDAVGARKISRGAQRGLQLEISVEALLNTLVEQGQLNSFVRHPSNSPEDKSGRDFTIRRIQAKEVISHSFGVTRSMKSWERSKKLYPTVKQLCFPLTTKPETMVRRILELFELQTPS